MTKSYKLLWGSFCISNVGDWLRKIALPILVFQKTGSAYHMATLYGITFIPWILFSILGGVLADKIKKSRIISYGHFISLFFLTLLIISLQSSKIEIVVIYFLTFLLSSTEPLIHPSFQSLLPLTVEKKNLAKANAGIQLVDNTLNLIGPMISGVLLLYFTPENSLWVNAAGYLLAGIFVLFINEDDVIQSTDKKSSALNDVKDGIAYVMENKVILSGAVLFLFTNLGINMFQSNLVYFITDILQYSSFQYGLILSISGIGAILGAFLAPKLNEKFKAGFVISVSTMCAGVFTLLLFNATNYIYIGVVMGLSNLCGNINVISYFSLRQRIVPQNILGRVVSVTRMISYLAIPVGAFLGGKLISLNYSIYLIILFAGTIRFFAGVFAFLSPLRKSGSE
ncbi:Transmembrane secretion effector [Pilibacter termitis]|uniref:Transmembrane secretion effector n=1 Tax=Pilibacter termitis TaxID=263852 RepID=A0A1T4MJF0_9ENTE|nr:MFS transporter [Pilibacter termitis]SJZ66966.1 Transmembrane secretion effector [Pilibacter termitis]